MVCNCREKFLKSVLIVVDHLQGFVIGKNAHRFETPAVLLVRVDVVVEEETCYRKSFFNQLPERVDGAGCTAGMEQDVFHAFDPFCLSIAFRCSISRLKQSGHSPWENSASVCLDM